MLRGESSRANEEGARLHWDCSVSLLLDTINMAEMQSLARMLPYIILVGIQRC